MVATFELERRKCRLDYKQLSIETRWVWSLLVQDIKVNAVAREAVPPAAQTRLLVVLLCFRRYPLYLPIELVMFIFSFLQGADEFKRM